MDSLRKSAFALLQEGTDFDRNGMLNDALSKYTAGVKELHQYTSSLPVDHPHREKCIAKIEEFKNRAETLRSQVRLNVTVFEQRQIAEDSTGHSYEVVFRKCLNDRLTRVDVQDAYIKQIYQLHNFVRFCEMLVKRAKNIRTIVLKTGENDGSLQVGFAELVASLQTRNITLIIELDSNPHDREIKFDNGWTVKIGRGLDYFKKHGQFALGAGDMNMRKCRKTTVDIFKTA